MTSNKEREKAIESIKPHLLRASKKDGSFIFIICVNRRDTESGITEYIRVLEFSGRSIEGYLTYNVAKALGHRYNEKHDTVNLGGYGYCRGDSIATSLASIIEKPIFVLSEGFAYGPRGWVFPYGWNSEKKKDWTISDED